MTAVTSNFISVLTADIKRQARNSREKNVKSQSYYNWSEESLKNNLKLDTNEL